MKYNIGDLFVSDIGCLMYIKGYTKDVLGARYKIHYYMTDKRDEGCEYSFSAFERMVDLDNRWKHYPVIK